MQESLVLEPAELQGEQLGLDQFRRHGCQLLLDELEAADGAIKLDAGFGVIERNFVARAGRTRRAPGDAIARFVQAGKRAAQSTHFRQHIPGGNAALLKVQFGGD